MVFSIGKKIKRGQNETQVKLVAFYFQSEISFYNKKIKLSASETGQGDLPRKKEEVGRLQRRVRTFKGNLTTAITSFVNRITHYKNKYPTDDEMEIPSIRSILTSMYTDPWWHTDLG